MKAVSDLIAPLSGEVLEVNQKVRRRARDRERGSLRRGWLDPRSGSPTRPRSTRCSTPTAYRELLADAVSYLSLTDADREEMLAAIGVASVEELFRDIPEGVRLRPARSTSSRRSPSRSSSRTSRSSRRGTSTPARELSFLGAGIYDHYVPAVVDAVLQRGEFLTAYTPYQPEMSQGVLQAIFEYQTAICELTGMDVSNASGYDGDDRRRRRLLHREARDRARRRSSSPRRRNPQVRQVVKTYAPGLRARGRRGAAPRRHDRSGRARARPPRTRPA